MDSDQEEQLFEIVQRLTDSRPFTTTNVARITQARLQRVSDASNAYFGVFRGQGTQSAVVSAAEVRVPTARSESSDGLVVLSIRIGVTRQAEVIRRFGPPLRVDVPTPRQPADAPVVIVYLRPWGEIRFGCTRDDRSELVLVVLESMSIRRA